MQRLLRDGHRAGGYAGYCTWQLPDCGEERWAAVGSGGVRSGAVWCGGVRCGCSVVAALLQPVTHGARLEVLVTTYYFTLTTRCLLLTACCLLLAACCLLLAADCLLLTT